MQILVNICPTLILIYNISYEYFDLSRLFSTGICAEIILLLIIFIIIFFDYVFNYCHNIALTQNNTFKTIYSHR